MAEGYRIKLWEVIVVIGLILLVVAALFPAVSVTPPYSNMIAVGSRGRDIYVAITGANTEREPLGLPLIWPSDAPPFTNHISGMVECFNFSNSSDYFYYIYDGANFGTEKHSPMVSGFDFGKLMGGGVTAHTGSGPLPAENNIWTIAKNIVDEMEDVIPLLITRNLDPEYLSATILDEPKSNIIPLGETWDTPFSNKSAVIIRKGGGMFRVNRKYATPMVIYNRQSFDANAGRKYPLKYLTPDKEVIPVGKTD